MPAWIFIMRFPLLLWFCVLWLNMDVSLTQNEPLGCGKPPALPDGDTKTSIKYWYHHNDQVEYVCQRDYILEGQPYIICRNGEWIGEIRCLKPCTVDAELMRQHNIEFKHRDTNKLYVPHNDAIEFRCTWGHRHVSTVSMQNSCERLQIDDAHIVYNDKATYRHNERVQYACINRGERLFSIRCETTGWTGIQSCTDAVCPNPQDTLVDYWGVNYWEVTKL
ncbi:hypothetical protein LDENG_00161550, partial [Lucifuga dentata]